MYYKRFKYFSSEKAKYIIDNMYNLYNYVPSQDTSRRIIFSQEIVVAILEKFNYLKSQFSIQNLSIITTSYRTVFFLLVLNFMHIG